MSKKEKPYVVQYPADFGGCGFWRLLWPQYLMNLKGLATVCHSRMFIRDFLLYHYATAVHIQRQIKPEQLLFFQKLKDVRTRIKAKLVYEVDDILFAKDIPDYNSAKIKVFEEGDKGKEIIELCDELTVTTPFLREYYLKNTAQKNITVIPNYPPLFWIGAFYSEELILRNFRTHRKKPRILYAGSASHFYHNPHGPRIADDFTHVEEAIMATVDEFQWVFVGARPTPLKHFLDTKMIEFHPWVHLEEYLRF